MHDYSLSSVIIAAGKSSRMRSSKPKIFHTIAGLPMVDHVVNVASQLVKDPKKDVVCVLNRFTHDAYKTDFLAKCQVAVQPVLDGTASAVEAALPLLDNAYTIILYGDVPLIDKETLTPLIEKAFNNKGPVILAFETNQPEGYGRLITDNGVVLAIREEKDCSLEEKAIPLCNSGIMVMSTSILKRFLSTITSNNNQGERYLTDLIEICRKEQLNCHYTLGPLLKLEGVNDRLQLAKAEARMQQQLQEDAMRNGVTFLDPSSVYLSYNTLLEMDVFIEPHVYFGVNTKVGSHSHIKSFSHLESVEIKEHCVIGPFARLRPGTILESRCKIGNFVEIKNAHLMSDNKVSHLSYLGDAMLEESCNIGAGVITCNYDGVKKSTTTIKKGAFIGSNAALVAPLVIGEKSVIGAGSVITCDVDDHSLALTRSKQVQKKL